MAQNKVKSKLEWRDLKIFSDPKTGLAVKLREATLPDGRLLHQWTTGIVKGQPGQEEFFVGYYVKPEPVNREVLLALIETAEDHARKHKKYIEERNASLKNKQYKKAANA